MSAATPRPDEGVISWNVNTACNYRCTYCTQRFKDDRGRWSRDTPRFLAAFARLPGRWEIKLSGGEPFVHPTLDEIAAGLVALGHRVSIVTNLSASRERLGAFVRAAAGHLGVFSCSLHLEYVDDVGAFCDKARWVADELVRAADPALPPPHLCVTSVATRAILAALPGLQRRFSDAGLAHKVQPEKQDGEVIDYTPAEAELLVQLGGHNRTGVIANDFRGRPCWAGSRYFVLDDLGQAFRCYPARRSRLEPLGDFLSPAFALREEPLPCRYQSCTCTVPIARGMMPREVA